MGAYNTFTNCKLDKVALLALFLTPEVRSRPHVVSTGACIDGFGVLEGVVFRFCLGGVMIAKIKTGQARQNCFST